MQLNKKEKENHMKKLKIIDSGNNLELEMKIDNVEIDLHRVIGYQIIRDDYPKVFLKLKKKSEFYGEYEEVIELESAEIVINLKKEV